MHIGPGDPTLSIVPVFGIDDEGIPQEFLGTGFFTGRQPCLVTCKHVLDLWEGNWAIIVTSMNNAMHTAELVTSDSDADIAVLRVDGYTPDNVLPLLTGSDYPDNMPVISLDYADSGKMGENFEISINTRHGGIIKKYQDFDRFGASGQSALELSYPALRGSSGSPILAPNVFVVLGVVRENVAHHLTASRLEPIYRSDGEHIAEANYEVPGALAIHSIHVQRILKSVGIEA